MAAHSARCLGVNGNGIGLIDLRATSVDTQVFDSAGTLNQLCLMSGACESDAVDPESDGSMEELPITSEEKCKSH